MARRNAWVLGSAAQAAYLAQLAHAVASGRAKIESFEHRSAAMESGFEMHEQLERVGEARSTKYERGQYELSLEVKTLDPPPNPYADTITGQELASHVTLAKRQLERVYASLDPANSEHLAIAEELVLFAANKQCEMEGKKMRTPSKSNAKISGTPERVKP